MKTADNLLDRIEKLNALGIGLSAEKDYDRLLERILTGAREITGADGGTLYIVGEERELRFEIVQTASLGLAMGGSTGKAVSFPPIPLYDGQGRPNVRTVAARAALENRIINIPDVSSASEYDFSGTREFDERTGYRSRSFLAVPMNDHEGRLIGVLQLINAVSARGGAVVPFSEEDERLVASLASQAALTLNRKRLIEELQRLLDSLAQLIATAIDQKSAFTGGHCRRVPVVTMMLADAADRCPTSPFTDVHFSEKERKALEMAAWLHDCGKIATPEYLVDKRTKLEGICDRLELIAARIEVMRRDARIACLEQKVSALQEGRREEIPFFEAELERRLEELAGDFGFLQRCNQGREAMAERALNRLAALSEVRIGWGGEKGSAPLLTQEELRCLSIPQGTLTAEERGIIQDHVRSTINMLGTLPLPDHLKEVPMIAGGHHERVDGKGYPLGLTAAQMPIQARILAIADVFEALTAADRPYRRANTLSEALRVMDRMRTEGHLDSDLFELFIRERIYLRYAAEHLSPEQIDEVDPALFIGSD